MVNFEHKIYFNDKPLPSFVIIKKIETQILADITNKTVKGSVGYRHKKLELGSKEIIITFSLERSGILSKFEQQQELIQWLKGDNWRESKLILPDNPDAYYMAICNSGIDLSYDDLEGEGKIEFLISNPYRIGTKTIKLNINELQSYSDKIGTENIKPKIIFTITSPCEEIKLSLKNNYYDNFIRFRHNFLTGDELVIDIETKKITLNGEIKMQILTLDSRFHELNNIIKDNIYTLETGNATVSLELQALFL